MSDFEGLDLQIQAQQDGVQIPPNEVITGVTTVNGTRVYVAASGAVFAPQGNFFGSYFNLPESARNDPNRRFNRIEATPSGYRIVSTTGEGYDFYNDFGALPTEQRPAGGAPAPATAPPAPSDPNAMGVGQQSAWEFVRAELDKWGLGNLASMARTLIVDGAGDEETLRRIRDTDTYRTRFAGMEARRKAGFNAISEADYLRMEDTYRGIMRTYGMPEGLYDDPSDFANYIANDLSAEEFNTRVAQGYQWALNEMDPFEKEQMRALYGLSDGDFAAMALDPDRALPFLEQRRTATEIAAQASRTGWGQLTAQEAESLQRLGVDEQAAGQGFSELRTLEPLFAEGLDEAGGNFSREDQLGIAFGNNTEQQERLSRRRRARVNRFQAGGGAAVTGAGVTGLGSAAT